jgi:hypothetical protein
MTLSLGRRRTTDVPTRWKKVATFSGCKHDAVKDAEGNLNIYAHPNDDEVSEFFGQPASRRSPAGHAQPNHC